MGLFFGFRREPAAFPRRDPMDEESWDGASDDSRLDSRELLEGDGFSGDGIAGAYAEGLLGVASRGLGVIDPSDAS